MSKKRYGNENHPLYARWLSMTQRCTNPNHKQFSDWGGRGISVDPYFKDFKNYVSYIESLPDYGTKGTVDRIDNSIGYTPGNLRWLSSSVQIANQRPNSRGNNKYTGVSWSKLHNCWVARIAFKGKNLLSSTHATEQDALQARNAYIKLHNLPHTIQ
jgi:hypothetical protein